VIELNEIKKRILEGEEIEDIIQKMDWKEFEKLIAQILKKMILMFIIILGLKLIDVSRSMC